MKNVCFMGTIDKILIIGHRGANVIAPENTLKAFKKAIDLKADYIELDIQKTKDGALVVTHDDDLQRLTGHHGQIKDSILKDLKSLDFGEGEIIPTLEEVIELTMGKINLNCEIKVEKISRKAVNIFKKYNVINSIILSSFIHPELLEFQRIAPKLKLASLEPTQYLRNYNDDRKKQMISFCIDNHLYAINPFYTIVDKDFVEIAHKNSIKVFPWTVDSKPIMRRLIKYGVDGIITNDIHKMKQVLSMNV
ncbi:hypothetical protein LCGC14_0589370 [marine sediment metagenome]|uniref:GP-PDE domain-containing protein n=1 Tax=marine sediment metagenome TaxID=412755 RepID=A0A0F9RXT9_9ZZZZ